MSETLNNSHENTDNASSEYVESMADAPAFDQESAKAARIKKYRSEHPFSEDDPGRAYEMATAGDSLETEAVHHLEDAKELMRSRGDTVYQRGDKIDRTDGTSMRVNDEHNSQFTGVDALDAARMRLIEADRAEEEAGRRYDKIQEMTTSNLRHEIRAKRMTHDSLRDKMIKDHAERKNK